MLVTDLFNSCSLLIQANHYLINELQTQFVNNPLVIRYIKALEAIRKFRQEQVGAMGFLFDPLLKILSEPVFLK